jgi:hypothetical protein
MGLNLVLCPDCATPLVLRFSLLANNGKLVHLTTCHVCADHITIRAWEELTAEEFKEMYMAGVPLVEYRA